MNLVSFNFKVALAEIFGGASNQDFFAELGDFVVLCRVYEGVVEGTRKKGESRG
jgi:hypothetical protein